jgi:uncharacterized membrane protein YdjX (TVP38/TMEM64 family)
MMFHFTALTVVPCLRYSAQLNLIGKELNLRGPSLAFLSQIGPVFGRSFFPLFAIAIIAGATLWGPWVSLAVTVLAVMAALRLL